MLDTSRGQNMTKRYDTLKVCVLVLIKIILMGYGACFLSLFYVLRNQLQIRTDDYIYKLQPIKQPDPQI